MILELRTIQKISIPTTLGSTDSSREYKIHEEMLFRPTAGLFSEEVMGLDLPVLFPLPQDIISSGVFPNWTSSTTHKLCVKVALGDSYITESVHIENFPIAIKLYDTLPLYRQYNEPMLENRISNDKQVALNLTIPISSVGPNDEFIIDLLIQANPLYNKINKNLKLKQLTFQIKEIIECHEGGLTPKKEIKLFTQTKDFLDLQTRLSTEGIKWQFRLPFPIENDSLKMFDMKDSTVEELQPSMENNAPTVSIANMARNKNIDKIDEGIPITHIQGFTTMGKLFSIRYEIVVKVKLSHGKDMDIRLPITVSAYDRASSAYILQWILKECDVARQRFGKDLVNYIAGRGGDAKLTRFVPPPIVYHYNRNDWVRLGFNPEEFGTKGTHSVQYID